MKTSDIAEVRRSAEALFASGLYCAESVVLAISEAEDVESELIPKLATGFCGGMSRTCGTCGALTGAIMGVGIALGRSSPKESTQPAYVATQQLIYMFEEQFGSRDCKTLLDGCDLNTPEGQTNFKQANLAERCVLFTGTAAEMAARAIVNMSGRRAHT